LSHDADLFHYYSRFDPLFGITNGAHTVFSLVGAHVSQDVLVTLAVVLVQAAMIIFSTKLVEMVNNAAVATEIIGIVGLTVVLAIAVIFGSDGSFSNLSSTGIVHDHWFTWLGPIMLSTLLGAYTIVGFLGWVVAAILLIWFSNRVFDLFTGSTQLPAMYYLATVLLYIATRTKLKTEKGFFALGRWEPLVVGAALVWLVYELAVVFGPDVFHKAAKYTLGMTLAGVVWIILLQVFHRSALEQPPSAVPDEAAAPEGPL
jgi:hypothetical protein